MRASLVFSFLASVAVACGSNPPATPEGSEAPPDTTSEAKTESPAPESTETPPAASTEAPAASTAPTIPPPPPAFTPEEEAAWKKSASKLDESAKKAAKACGTTLTVDLPKDRWTGKVLAASGPDALAGGGLPVCTAGLDAMTDVCKKDAKLKTAFAGWIKQYRCWPAAGPSVGTADDAFELAFSLPGRTPADYKKMVAEALEGSLKAAATK